MDQRTQELLEDILEVYGQRTTKYLEELTHHEAPWKIARGELPPDERSSANQLSTSLKLKRDNRLKDKEN